MSDRMIPLHPRILDQIDEDAPPPGAYLSQPGITTPPSPQIEHLGRMSAEAVLRQYEEAARSVQAMGDEVKVRIDKLTTALRECEEAMHIVDEAAKSIVERGKVVYLQVEEASTLCRDIREAAVSFRKKVGA